MFDFADVKPSVMNWVIVGLLAITFIVFMKFAVNKFDVPFLSSIREVVNSV